MFDIIGDGKCYSYCKDCGLKKFGINEIDAVDSKPLKLRFPFDLLEPEHFSVPVKKSSSDEEPEDEGNQKERERIQRELTLEQINAMRIALDFEGSDGDDSQFCLEFKHGDDKVFMLKNGNIAIGDSSYLPSDVEFVFGTPIGQATIVLTDDQLRTYLGDESDGLPYDEWFDDLTKIREFRHSYPSSEEGPSESLINQTTA